MRSSNLDGSAPAAVQAPSDIGFAIPDSHGNLTVGLRDGLYQLHPTADGDHFQRLTQPDFDPRTHRINDGKPDRAGRLWFGTMDEAESEPSGALYRFASEDTRPHRTNKSAVVSNGIGWSPEGTTMYYADSGGYDIVAFDYDPAEGEITNERPFAHDEKGHPDGLTVDAEGCVWSAKWDDGAVVRYDPSGGVMQRYRLPVSRPTSCAFAGPLLDLLVVTTAQRGNPASEPLGGRVFLLSPGVCGLPETPVAC